MIKRVIVSTLLVGCVALGKRKDWRWRGTSFHRRRRRRRGFQEIVSAFSFVSFVCSLLPHFHHLLYQNLETSKKKKSTAAAQGDSSSAASAAATKSKGADALDAMLSTSKASAPAAKNGDMKNSTSSSSSSPAPTPASSLSSSAPSPPAAPKSNAGGSSAAGCSTPLQWLQNSGNYKKFLQLIDATPASARLADILDSPDVALTLLAPTDEALSDSLAKQGLSFSDLVVS